MSLREVDTGERPGVRWRVVQDMERGDYALQEIFTPDNPTLPRQWRSTPLDQIEVWRRYPAEAPRSFVPYARRRAPWWYRLFWGVDTW